MVRHSLAITGAAELLGGRIAFVLHAVAGDGTNVIRAPHLPKLTVKWRGQRAVLMANGANVVEERVV